MEGDTEMSLWKLVLLRCGLGLLFHALTLVQNAKKSLSVQGGTFRHFLSDE
jgi:hypothetical protein